MRVRVSSVLVLAACLLVAAVAVSATEVDAELPGLNQACKAFGAIGTCKAEASCTNGRSYYGFCAGASNIKCCVPAVLKSGYASNKLNKITQTRAERLKEAEHKAKWAAFKALNRKSYSSAAVEAQRYAQFKVNREAIVNANDRHGKGKAIFRSAAPFADLPPAVFRQQYLNLKLSETRQALLEIETDDLEKQTALLEMNNWLEAETATKADADAETETEVEAEVDAEVDAEADAEAETETEAEVPNPNMAKSACKGAIKTGLCSGKTDFCCVPIVTSVATPAVVGGASSTAPKITSSAPAKFPNAKAAAPPTGPIVGIDYCTGGSQCMTLQDCGGYGGLAQYPQCGVHSSYGPMYCCTVPNQQSQPTPAAPAAATTGVATLSIDYRGLQSPIKNQGQCGSCWAHAAVEAYEAAGVRAGKWDRNTQFSVQQVVDCTPTSFSANGCNGAVADAGLRYLAQAAPASVKAYPYQMRQTQCQNASTTAVPLASYGHTNAIGGYCWETACTVERIRSALEKYGPMVVTVDATNWQHYTGGVFPNAECTGQINHAVLLIGWGHDAAGQPFWLVRNSWGTQWGEGGFIRLDATSSAVGCSVALDGVYAIF